MININIDGKDYEVEERQTILEAARKNDISIPTLCYLKEINQIGACRMCLVEVEGARGYVTACTHPVEEGMIIRTATKELIKHKKVLLELILSNHERSCLTCKRSFDCELQKLCKQFGIEELPFEGEKTKKIYDDVSHCVVRNTAKCILCRKCVSVCKEVQGVCAIETIGRGFDTKISSFNDMSLASSTCVGCGQCINNCPTGALEEKSFLGKLEEILNDRTKHVVIQTAPSVRAAIGEEFGMGIGTLATGKMVAGLRKLGFDRIFDTDLGADVTIMEEGEEFLSRLNKNDNLPMITSCSSGWITYAEKFYPELLKNLSTTKSPMEIMGTLIKKYYSEKEGIKEEDIYSVALMPCSAKKAEIEREQLKINSNKMVDLVVTTREIARFMKQNNIDISKLEEEEFDNPLGLATGAGHIFGVTGGVMEAAVRNVYKTLTKEDLENLEFKELRENKDIREATLKIGEKEINICVAQGLKNISKVMDEIKEGKSKYHFIEVMTCPGGCINGGGQPLHSEEEKERIDILGLRKKALYKADEKSKYRVSQDNPMIKEIYKNYLEKPNSEKAEELLHTSYNKQNVYEED